MVAANNKQAQERYEVMQAGRAVQSSLFSQLVLVEPQKETSGAANFTDLRLSSPSVAFIFLFFHLPLDTCNFLRIKLGPNCWWLSFFLF